MARYSDASCRLCRREGQKLFLKGERCYSTKCAIEKRNYAPGQHGQSRKKVSEYGLQLREKQKAKRFYGVLESQFRNYFDKAEKKKGITGENLLIMLETRLDNVVFRMGFASSRKEARQLVRHGHFTVNGRKQNIPSFAVKAGDVIKVKEKSVSSPKFKEIKEMSISVPSWITVDVAKLEGKVVAMPSRDDIDTPIAEHLIVELYSK
ncbi:MAG: 30S ribosomal protein S4 [Anaerovoracaceae bacterium]|jgi:small subunit ribosomal protein S4